MAHVLVVADTDWIADWVSSVLSRNDQMTHLRSGRLVSGWLTNNACDLVVTDSQVGSMGGIAVCHDLRLEVGAARLAEVPVLVLLDRRADIHLARRAQATGWLVKPFDAVELEGAVTKLLAGEGFRDSRWMPDTVPLASR